MADPQESLRLWIMEGLKRKGYGSGRELARRIGVEPEVLTRMKNTDGLKETRRIEAHMIPTIAEFFESIPPGFEIVADLKCTTCSYPLVEIADFGNPQGNQLMPAKGSLHIATPQHGTFVIGDNNTVTINNSQSIGDVGLSADQAMRLDSAVNDVAAARGTAPESVWKDLCSALDVADAALITRSLCPAAEKILANWKGEAIREAVNEKGG